ncbi:hypothetical protein EX30DRAFT_339213 [Ascodesmis nigricans]|uniref:Exocyst complex component SEC5 n=1 Tax=Ascodesmis nigricans TaxID=341454 RepID=A0A4S2N1Y7_9PEZI|nr:hypothetical protein EX30DRAFT_339213 [Ascodesmis nigricans]
MTDSRSEAALLTHYRLQDPFPTSWSDPIEEEQAKQRVRYRQSTSRYSVLQEDGLSSSLKGLVGGDLYSGGPIPEDEPDPLGSVPSVARALLKRGIPVDDNVRLRQRYLISSKNFSPAAFLRDVHSNTPTPALQQGLEFLATSIAKKSESLKVLVETNFDRFVAAKATIEGVYKEMKDNKFLTKDKEAEYGVGKIRAYLNEAGEKAEEVFGPVMAGRGREEGLRLLLHTLEKHGNMLDMPRSLADAIKRKDNATLLEEYQKARKYVTDVRSLVPNPAAGIGQGVKEEHLYQLILAEKMWIEAESTVATFKDHTWAKLLECKADDTMAMELISVLLEIGVEENPALIWLHALSDKIRERLQTTFESSRVEIEVARRKVGSSPQPRAHTVANYLRAPSRRLTTDGVKHYDTVVVNHFWETFESGLLSLLDPKCGILGEILGFWKSAQSFIDGDNILPVGIDGKSQRFHRFSDKDVTNLRDSAQKLVTALREKIISFFQDPPPEDVPAHYNSAPNTPLSGTFPTNAAFPRMIGQEGDIYAFFPPGANSLGGACYLSKATTLLGNASVLLAENFSSLPSAHPIPLTETLRTMLATSRDRMVSAILTAWLSDAENCKVMEDWTRSPNNRGVTKMPNYFLRFSSEVIAGMQSIVYLDKVRNADSTNVIPPPSAKLLNSVRAQFVRTMYTALEGMIENAKNPVTEADWVRDRNGLHSPMPPQTPINLTANSVNCEDLSVRMLLTLSNLSLLRNEIIADLISTFESTFTVKLTDESKTIKNALVQIHDQLFTEYTTPLIQQLSEITQSGILSPTWAPNPGRVATEVKPYVYDALLLLVDVHAQVTTTAPSLTNTVLTYLLEQLSRLLLEAFKQRKEYDLGGLLQATLDVEFVNQTLTQYASGEALKWQSEVYVLLDKGSTEDARRRLKEELPELKRVLSSLRRYSRAEFLCFRAKKTNVKGRVRESTMS